MSNEIEEKFIDRLIEIFSFKNSSSDSGINRIRNLKKILIVKLTEGDLLNELHNSGIDDEFKEEIFSQILDFLTRYYDKSDFNIKKKQIQNQLHHIPSNGEQVLLYWITKDQNFVPIEAGEYFIHKNLKGFLMSELDFFITNEVLAFKDITVLKNEDIQPKLIKAKLVSNILSKIITILSKIEDIQLKILNKNKFVLKTNFVISLDKIKEFGGENYFKRILDKILSNKKQLQEWNDLFKIELIEKLKSTELKKKLRNEQLGLPLDTRFFTDQFKWDLLTAITKNNNLEEILEGVLIRSDNYQGLNLIKKKWVNKINLIYIDPPFNTGSKDFPYKNDYLESSWLTSIYNGLVKAKEILNKEGNIFVRIDTTGNHLIRFLLDQVFGKSNFRNEIIINKTKAKRHIKKPFIQQTESLFFYSMTKDYFFNQLEIPREVPKWYELLDFPRPNTNPRIIQGKTYYPPNNRRWGLSQERINMFEQKGKTRINKNKSYTDCFGKIIEEKPELLYDVEPIRNNWLDIPGYSQVHKFSTENSEVMLQRVIESGSKEGDVILDYFLGSGTTTATAQKLKRKWIGIEVGDQFEDFILPRMKSVLRGDKSGISKVSKDTPIKYGGFFKYQYLEQFGDTLENVEFDDTNDAHLNINYLDEFSKIEIELSEETKSKAINVDLIESFNYLIGINVETMKQVKNNGRAYLIVTGKVKELNVVVIWRSIIDIDYEKDKKYIDKHLIDMEVDLLYVNDRCLVNDCISINSEIRKLIWNN